jgi:2-polyprenyl-6-methoxyphenol hydroxylase-like FAD-dependent oxidoreductase
MDAEIEVLIIGAGPSGLALSCELKRLGVPAMTVDRQAAGANTSRAAVVHARTLEVLEPTGVTQRLLANGVQVPVFTVRDRDRVLASISFRELETKYPFTLMCPQDRTEHILLTRLIELGGSVVRPWEAVSFREQADFVEVALRGPEAQAETIRANWLVGCDGAHSAVRNYTGIPFEGGAYEQVFVLADLQMEWPISRDEVCLFLSPRGLVVVAPLPEDHFRVVATVEQAAEHPSREDVQAILDERGPEKGSCQIQQCVWTSRFHIQHRVAAHLRRGHVLLVGDAAHVHSPAGGQGMNTGIQDAASLAQALSKFVQGGDTGALDEWEEQRLRVAREVVSVTDRMTRAATIKSRIGIEIRNALISFLGHSETVAHAIAARLAELGH